MTNSEVVLWSKLKHNQLGFKFRRQFGVGPYIIDFYCPQLKFAVEVDGEVHALNRVKYKDKVREKFLKDFNILVKRYWNYEVIENIDSVIEEIYYLCQQLKNFKDKRNSVTPQSPPKTRGRIKRGLI